jgi:glyoxylase-like metal-dependent hydrolase (beta-lactamase superfamily II)
MSGSSSVKLRVGWGAAALLTAFMAAPGCAPKSPPPVEATSVVSASVPSAPGDDLPSFAPLLPNVRASAWVVDPKKGYLVRELKPGIFMVVGGGYESAFATTGKGVVLFDAPPVYAQHLVRAVAEVTTEPIVELVYSHLHVDHIGGAGVILKQVPNLKILAEEGTAAFLRDVADPNRPPPTTTFKDRQTLHVGTMTVELALGHWHTPDGDLLIYWPDQKVLMAVDALSKGAVPFMGLDLSMNMHEYSGVFDKLLAYDWDVMVPGHHTNPVDREDVQITKAYVSDLYSTIVRILAEDHSALKAKAVQKYGQENSFAIARVLVDHEVDECAREITDRWASRLEDVDVWASSHCRTTLVYAEWDVGSRKPVP